MWLHLLLSFWTNTFIINQETPSLDSIPLVTVKRFENNTKKPLKQAEVYLQIDQQRIYAKDTLGGYLFPEMDTTAVFDFIIVSDREVFKVNSIKPWRINQGARVVIGIITDIRKLESVAQYSSLSKDDLDYEQWSKQFFLAEERFTLDIEEPEKVRKLKYMLLSSPSKGVNIIQSEVIKKKNN